MPRVSLRLAYRWLNIDTYWELTAEADPDAIRPSVPIPTKARMPRPVKDYPPELLENYPLQNRQQSGPRRSNLHDSLEPDLAVPTLAEQLINQLQADLNSGNFAEARARVSQIDTVCGGSPLGSANTLFQAEALLACGLAYRNIGENSRALEYFEKSLKGFSGQDTHAEALIRWMIGVIQLETPKTLLNDGLLNWQAAWKIFATAAGENRRSKVESQWYQSRASRMFDDLQEATRLGTLPPGSASAVPGSGSARPAPAASTPPTPGAGGPSRASSGPAWSMPAPPVSTSAGPAPSSSTPPASGAGGPLTASAPPPPAAAAAPTGPVASTWATPPPPAAPTPASPPPATPPPASPPPQAVPPVTPPPASPPPQAAPPVTPPPQATLPPDVAAAQAAELASRSTRIFVTVPALGPILIGGSDTPKAEGELFWSHDLQTTLRLVSIEGGKKSAIVMERTDGTDFPAESGNPPQRQRLFSEEVFDRLLECQEWIWLPLPRPTGAVLRFAEIIPPPSAMTAWLQLANVPVCESVAADPWGTSEARLREGRHGSLTFPWVYFDLNAGEGKQKRYCLRGFRNEGIIRLSNGERYAFMRVTGDSMDAAAPYPICAGDWVLVRRADKPNDHKIVVANVKDPATGDYKATLKRKRSDGLYSESQTDYPVVPLAQVAGYVGEVVAIAKPDAGPLFQS